MKGCLNEGEHRMANHHWLFLLVVHLDLIIRTALKKGAPLFR